MYTYIYYIHIYMYCKFKTAFGILLSTEALLVSSSPAFDRHHDHTNKYYSSVLELIRNNDRHAGECEPTIVICNNIDSVIN